MFQYLDKSFAPVLVEHQTHFPEKMREMNLKVWEETLESTPYSIGYFKDNQPVAWRIFKRESEKVIYVAELLVLPFYRGQGLAKQLIIQSLIEPRLNEESIHSFLRVEAYKAVANAALIKAAGYKIVINIFIDGHYKNRFGVHEDAYELLIVPDKAAKDDDICIDPTHRVTKHHGIWHGDSCVKPCTFRNNKGE